MKTGFKRLLMASSSICLAKIETRATLVLPDGVGHIRVLDGGIPMTSTRT